MAFCSSTNNRGNNPLVRQITVTFLLIALYRLGVHVSLPFVDENALVLFFHGRFFDRISIFSLGIMPYVSAYLFVEIGSLFIPFLKKLRKGDYNGRSKLKRWAFALAFFLAVFQSWGIVRGLRAMTSTDGVPVLNITGLYDHTILISILVGGVFFLIYICELISRYGFGNGVSVIILTGICAGYGYRFVEITRLFHEVGPGPYVLALVFAFIIALATVVLLKTKINILLRHGLSGESVPFFQLNTCPSGTVAIPYAVSLIMLPGTLSHFFGWGDRFIGILSPSGLSYNVSLGVFIFVFSYLFAYLFFHPKRRLDKMSERGWQFPGSDHVKLNYLSRKCLIYNFPWTILLCALAIIPHILITQFNLPFSIGGSSLFLPIAISLDILDRLNVLRKSKSGRLCKIAELHDVYDASMIKNHMQSEEIICHFQGYYHRHLLYFFGPYIDISVMVLEGEKESAQELIGKYYNALGIVRNR